MSAAYIDDLLKNPKTRTRAKSIRGSLAKVFDIKVLGDVKSNLKLDITQDL